MGETEGREKPAYCQEVAQETLHPPDKQAHSPLLAHLPGIERCGTEIHHKSSQGRSRSLEAGRLRRYHSNE